MSDARTKEGDIRLSNGAFLEPFIEDLLGRRGVHGAEEILNFMEPKLEDLPDPFLMKGMERAVGILEKALDDGHSILIWGDYDVDGTTATALLTLFFRSLKMGVEYHIPNRLTEGYGIQREGLERLTQTRDPKRTVLVTVDNGISAHEAMAYAATLGYRTIVSDHHLPPEQEVEADAILNPNQPGCSFPEKGLAGVGVAFYLAMGLRRHLSQRGYYDSASPAPNLKQYLDLVAVGTVADMVPLGRVNRILVKAGMETLAEQGNHGLSALCRRCNLDTGYIRSEDISFQLAPKINAAGRLGHAEVAVSLFLAGNKKEAVAIAKGLLDFNDRRRSITLEDVSKAIAEVEAAHFGHTSSTVIAGEYHVGVAGIVASNLVEKYQRPAVALCDMGDGILKGSARSVAGVDLYQILTECSAHLLAFGGHRMAGGMSLKQEELPKFREVFDQAAERQNAGNAVGESQEADADLEIGQLFKGKLLGQLHMLEPFGQGNPQPIFRDTTSDLKELSQVGKDGSHLRLSVINGRGSIQGIAFGMGGLLGACRTAKDKEILYTPSINFFKGKRSWQVRVTNITFPND